MANDFFEESHLVSDHEMQDLWARLLAGHANEPSTFSKRTIETIAFLDKVYAELFTKADSFVWVIYQQFVLFIYDVQELFYNKAGLNYTSLSHLNKLGVINFINVTDFAFTDKLKIKLTQYFETPISLEFKNASENTLQKVKSFYLKSDWSC